MAKKRALILAGGGVKVAFQAGVLQVWLDEAGLSFDLADGASGGAFNLAMWCQGMSGNEIADAWRRTKPIEGISINAIQFPRLLWVRSLFTLDSYRRNVFPSWNLDWTKIRNSTREATFNVFNFSKQELELRVPAEMDEDWLCACVSLPMWFEPVVRNGDTYIDAVYATDANVEEAVRRGADELWIIWTVSQAGRWEDGFVANYFQIIEAAANSNFKQICRRIEANNVAFAAGQAAEFGRQIDLRILKAEVPIHYLVNFSQDRLVECVNLGVESARRWCVKQGIALQPGPEVETDVHTVQTRLQFSEEMKGFAALNEADYQRGYVEGKHQDARVGLRLTIVVDGVNRFISNPRHEAAAEGWIDISTMGGERPVIAGTFNLFVDDGDPQHRAMYYRLWFSDPAGRPFTFLGFKDIKDDPGVDEWTDTTTLYSRILEGHITPDEDGVAKIVGAGILRLHFADFLKELTTFKVEGPTTADRSAALVRFGKLFLGKMWDVYATQMLSSGPF